jgi:hypothetical protein
MPIRCEGTLSQSGSTLELDRQRVRRWQQRRTTGRLDDQPPDRNPIHCILEWEGATVIELFDEWGEVDLSYASSLTAAGIWNGGASQPLTPPVASPVCQ